MRRREFLGVLGGAATWPVVAQAQPAGKILRIGMLDVASKSINAANVAALRQGLQQLGYVDGQNLVISYRFARGEVEQFAALAAELLRQDINVFVTRGTPATLAAKNATTIIPVVMAASGDPVRAGLVSSLARPGGNVTGLSAFLIDLAAKRFELLKEMTGQVDGVAFLDNLANPIAPALWEETKIAASALNVEPVLLDVAETGRFRSCVQERKCPARCCYPCRKRRNPHRQSTAGSRTRGAAPHPCALSRACVD